MKKISAIILAFALASVAAIPSSAQDTIDLIVLMDSSKSMFKYYEDVVDYVLSATARDYLRFGDSFHLLTFADDVQVEMSQPLKTEQDLKSVIARLYLLYPLGKNTDLITALEKTYDYVASIPGSASKVIVLITDGVHSPAPSTPYAGLDAQAVSAKVESAATKIKERGWTLKIVRVPFDDTSTASPGSLVSVGAQAGTPGAQATGASGSAEAAPTAPGAGNYLDTVAAAGGATVSLFDPSNGQAAVDTASGLPEFVFPSSLTAKGSRISLPAELRNRSSAKVSLSLESLLLDDGRDILSKKQTIALEPGASAKVAIKVALPRSVLKTEVSVISVEPRFEGGARVSPARSTIRIEKAGYVPEPSFWSPARIAALAAIVALAVVTIALVSGYARRMHRKVEEPIVEAMIDSAAAKTNAERASSRAALARGAASSYGKPIAGTAASGAAVAGAPVSGATVSAALDSGAVGAGSRASANAAFGASSRHEAPHAVGSGRVAGRSASDGYGADRSKTLDGGSQFAHRDAKAQAELLSEAGSSSHQSDARAATVLDSWKAPAATRRALPLKTEPEHRVARESWSGSFTPRIVTPGAQRFVMYVEGQNANIGKRNIHVIHAGGKKTVGGGSSDFLVFLLPVPRHIADVHFDGDGLTLVPLLPAYFPDATGPIERCDEASVRIVTDSGKELSLRFERYVPPVEALNKILHCIDMPGLGLGDADVHAPETNESASQTRPTTGQA